MPSYKAEGTLERLEKTLPGVSRLSNPAGALRKCFRDDDLAVCFWLGWFPWGEHPTQIRVTVEWDDATISPPISKSLEQSAPSFPGGRVDWPLIVRGPSERMRSAI